MAEFFSINIRVTMPGKILDHNADTQDGNTLTWAVDLTSGTLDISAESDPKASSGGSSMLIFILIGAAVLIAAFLFWWMKMRKGSGTSRRCGSTRSHRRRHSPAGPTASGVDAFRHHRSDPGPPSLGGPGFVRPRHRSTVCPRTGRRVSSPTSVSPPSPTATIPPRMSVRHWSDSIWPAYFESVGTSSVFGPKVTPRVVRRISGPSEAPAHDRRDRPALVGRRRPPCRHPDGPGGETTSLEVSAAVRRWPTDGSAREHLHGHQPQRADDHADAHPVEVGRLDVGPVPGTGHESGRGPPRRWPPAPGSRRRTGRGCRRPPRRSPTVPVYGERCEK